MSDDELEQAQAEIDRLRAELTRLRSRRSVRIALSLASLLRPLFRRKNAERPVPVRTRGWRGTVPSGPATVVVPIHNAYQELERCLRSLVRNTTGDVRLLLIDDASTDERIPPLLADYGRLNGVDVLTNGENLGFTRTVNRGFEQIAGDVVVLNSDVAVPPGWLRRLRLAAYSEPKVGTVTALSDNAGAFSAPEAGQANDVPAGVTGDEAARAVAQAAARSYPQAPTGNAFCMLIRREVLDEVGPFDAEAFPRGYGEENDLSMRALRRGWVNVVDDATYVLHTRSASFGREKEDLADAGLRVLEERYPEYPGLVRDFGSSQEMAAARATVGRVFDDLASGGVPPRPRVLFALHDAGGGTPATTGDLSNGLSSAYESLALISNGTEVRLERLGDAGGEELLRERLDEPIRPDDFTHDEYRGLVTDVLVRYDIDVAHVRHLIGHSFDLPEVAQSLDIPVVLSFHDFYYVCPTVHLMDNEGMFCGGQCTPGDGECPVPVRWLQGLPHLKHDWVYDWRKHTLEMFGNVDALVTASRSAKDYYLEVFPELTARRFDVIEHGRDLQITSPPIGVAPNLGEPVRILLLGHLDPHKGSRLVKRLVELDEAKRLEFHVLGRVDPTLDGLVVDHGTYGREEFAGLARSIAPSFVGLFSTTAESHSHTLSEAWSAGIPVLASSLGALGERVERHGGGWLVDVTDPTASYARILEIADDEAAWAAQVDMTRSAASALRTIDQMASDYADLYAQLSRAKLSFA